MHTSPSTRVLRRVLFPCAIAVSAPMALAAPTFVQLGQRVDSVWSAATSRFATLDIDGDGFEDLVFAGVSGSPILFAIGKRADETIGFKMAKIAAADGALSRVLAWTPAGTSTPHVLTVAQSGVVRDYSGWPLTEQRQFSVTGNATAAAVGDVDNDGVDDLLVTTQSGLYAYSLANGLPEWNYPVADSRDLALVQLDADPALEIILAGPVPGIVLDGATRATDWQYIDGYGSRLATGALLGSGGVQWVGAADWNLFTVFRATPWSPLWSGSTSHDIGAIATARVDGSGRDVIVQGDGQWGKVHVIDSATHQERFQVPNDGYGISAVAGVDFDGNGIDEIAFASAQTSQDGPLLTIASGQNGAVTWQFFPIPYPFVATALGDVDGDGHVELVAASAAENSHSTIVIFDAETGTEEWRSPAAIGNVDEPLYLSVATIALVPHAVGQGMDIVLAGSAIYDGRIVVLDGTTRDVRLQIGGYFTGPMVSRYVRDMALIDFNNDGVQDYVAATEASSTGSQAALLQVFSGVDGSTLWTSVAMGSGFATINGVLVAEPPVGMPGKRLVAVLPASLRAYDTSTGLLSWTIATTNDGAHYIPNGTGGAELAVYSADSGAVTFYSADTQANLRSYSLPAPLSVVTSLGGDLHSLVVATADALALVDGESGVIKSATDYLGPFPPIGSRIASIGDASSSWTIATGTEAALYRYRLQLGDAIFANSFESP